MRNTRKDYTIPITAKPPPNLTPLLRIATLAHQIAERYLAGKSGMAVENACREVIEAWDVLPDEVRKLL